jgi:hypothetical protein
MAVLERKTKVFSLNLTPETRRQLARKAGELDLSIGELARRYLAAGLASDGQSSYNS